MKRVISTVTRRLVEVEFEADSIRLDCLVINSSMQCSALAHGCSSVYSVTRLFLCMYVYVSNLHWHPASRSFSRLYRYVYGMIESLSTPNTRYERDAGRQYECEYEDEHHSNDERQLSLPFAVCRVPSSYAVSFFGPTWKHACHLKSQGR